MRIDKGNRNTLKSPATMSRCSWIIHNLTEDWTRSAAVIIILVVITGSDRIYGAKRRSWREVREILTGFSNCVHKAFCLFGSLCGGHELIIINYAIIWCLKRNLASSYVARRGDNWVIGKGKKKKRKSYSCNRPWKTIELWDVEAPIISRQSAHRWRWDCQPYSPVDFPLPTGRFLVIVSAREKLVSLRPTRRSKFRNAEANMADWKKWCESGRQAPVNFAKYTVLPGFVFVSK
jgi:hypothetical protein